MTALVFILLLMTALPAHAEGDKSLRGGAGQVIADLAYEALQRHHPGKEIRFELTPRWIPASLRETAPENIKNVQLAGAVQRYTNFEVIYNERGRRQSAEIQFAVEAEQKVPVLTERKRPGIVLKASDFKQSWVELSFGRDVPITRVQQLEGSTLRRMLNAGSFVTENDISAALLVKAGEPVKMVYKQNGLMLTIACEARQDGALNEEIQIYCKETRKKYLGKVTARGATTWLKTH